MSLLAVSTLGAVGRATRCRRWIGLAWAAHGVLACLLVACEPSAPSPLDSRAVAPAPTRSSTPASTTTTTTPVPRRDPHATERQAEIHALADRASIELVFLGDSITRRWAVQGAYAWNQHYRNRRAANFGIDGDRTEHVLWRLENGNLDGLDPKLVVLLIGTNNTPQSTDVEIAQGIRRIVEVLRGSLPRSRILLLGVLPRRPDPGHPIRARIRHINALIAPAAVDAMVDYLDIGSVFTQPDGSIARFIMPDFLHLSPRAYTLFAGAIEERLAAGLAAAR